MGFLSNMFTRMKNRQNSSSEIPAPAESLAQKKPSLEHEKKSDPLEPFDREIVDQINLFSAELSDVYLKAQKKLVAMGEPAIEPLIIALNDQNAEIGRLAAECLGKIGGSRVLRPLVEILQKEPKEYESYEEKALRIAAAKAISGVKTQAAAEPLIKVLDENNGYTESLSIEDACIKSLGEIGDPVAIKPLSKYLEGDYYYGNVKPTAIEALGKIKDPKAIQLIINDLNTSIKADCYYGQSTEQSVSIRALKGHSGPEVFEVLTNCLKTVDDFRVKMSIIETIDDLANIDFQQSYYLDSMEGLIDLFYDPRNLELISSFSDKKDPGRINHIFRDYTTLIVDSASPYKQILEADKIDYARFSHDTSEGLNAVKSLCEINSPVSTNILHKILGKQDISVCIQRSCSFETFDSLSYENQRALAKKELIKRGNALGCKGITPYKPSAYHNYKNWRI